MKKTLTIILFFIASVGFSQTTDYKNAYQISKKLNTQFKTDKFTVVLLSKGQIVYKDAG